MTHLTEKEEMEKRNVNDLNALLCHNAKNDVTFRCRSCAHLPFDFPLIINLISTQIKC